MQGSEINIPTPLLSKLAEFRIPGEAMQVLMVILSRTYGWQQKLTHIPTGEIEAVTGIKKPNVVRSINRLYEMGVIIINTDNNINKRYAVNVDFDAWKKVQSEVPKRVNA